MRPLDHRRKAGYLAALKQIGLNARTPEPPPKAAWYRVLLFTMRSWAVGR